ARLPGPSRRRRRVLRLPRRRSGRRRRPLGRVRGTARRVPLRQQRPDQRDRRARLGSGDARPAGARPHPWRRAGPGPATCRRRCATAGPGGALAVRTPDPHEMRDGPALPRIAGFPTELIVWLGDGSGGLTEVLRLAVKRTRLLADFADPKVPGDRRWWENWD